MHSETFEQLVDRAAAQCGIDEGYWDIWGHYHTTSMEAKQAILRAKGLDAQEAASLEQSLAAMARREWSRLVPPAVVVGQSDEIVLPLNLPADSLGQRAHITVRPEEGPASEYDVNIGEMRQTHCTAMDGRTWIRSEARIRATLPLGYHDVVAQVGTRSGTTRYIVTPDRAYAPPHLGRGGRTAGISVSLYGLRSARNWGCGDFRDLLDLVDWVAEDLGASFVGLNPLHAIPNRRPFNTSPYLPTSMFYQNFLYLDVEGMEDFGRSRRAQACLRSPATQAEIASLREAQFVEYERVAALKMRLLKLQFVQFLRERRQGTARAGEFAGYLAREGQLLEKFATWCALDEHLHQQNPNLWVWPNWPEEYRDPDSPAVAAFRKRNWRRVMFYQYLQWQIDLQLRRAQQKARDRGLALGLYHDLALATDSLGSDLWAHRPFYVSGCRVGSPPDDFSPKGQDWGFPPPASDRHRENGYCLFAESIRKNCRHGGALRIDHVMRLFRLYWIPDASDATHGAYVRERSEDFVRVLALESVRNRVVIVGEDLGTVEPQVRETLARYGILSYRVFYFEKDAKGEFRRNTEYPARALVSSTTHDLPTLAGFWTGADIDARRAAGMIDDGAQRAQKESRATEKQKMLDMLFALNLLPGWMPRQATDYAELTGELHNAIVGFLAGTPSQLLAINQEDLTKEMHQQNLPGTTWQYPNWGRKMRFTVEELRSNGDARAYTEMFRNWIVNSGRGNPQAE
jgi:4-alpha-glucanotransferase